MFYIGVDLGTSAVKLLLMDSAGTIVNIVSREYPLYFPHLTAEADSGNFALIHVRNKFLDSFHGITKPVFRFLLRPSRMRKI